jgi:hypothetical protein
VTKPKRGVRIPYVRDARGVRHGPSAIDVKPHPPYVLPLTCWGCGVEVHVRHGNADDPDSTSSHYVKNPGKKHGPRCAYDLERRGKELVDASGSTVVHKGGQWRLICPPLKRAGTRGAGKRAPRPAAGGRASGAGPAKTSKEAGQAIASARRIVRLLEAFKQDPDVVAQFAATAPGGQRNIEWQEFCRGRADAHQLAQDLIDGTATPIPHAVWGPVSSAAAVDGKPDRSYKVQYVARHPVLIGNRRLPLHVTLRSTNSDWIGATTRSGKFLGYGYWKIWPKPEDVGNRIELQLWINEPWQVDRWDTDGTTQTFPAPPPRPAPPPSPSRNQREPSKPVVKRQVDVPKDAPTRDPAPLETLEQAGPSAPPAPWQPVPAAAGKPGAEEEPQSKNEEARPSAPSGQDEAGPPDQIAADAAQDTAAAEARAEASAPVVPPVPAVPPKPSQPPRPTSPPSRRRRPRLTGWLGRRSRRR